MEVKYISIHNIPKIEDELSLCLGYFDGLHLGHLSLIEKAKESPFKKALLTLKIDTDINIKNKAHITSINDKIDILTSLDMDYLFVLTFDKEAMSLTSEEFVKQILLPLNAKEIIVGKDYHFGKGKMGDYQTLNALSNNNYEVKVVDELVIDGKKVGTSSIIEYLKNGEITKVNNLLSRLYKITGIVQKGYHFGTKKNIPTANISLNGYVKPKNGVYATLIKIDDKILKGMTNVGIHPSINKLEEEIIETNIFDFDEDIYSKEISIYFIDFIREEKQFDSVDDLYAQLENDKISCQTKLDNYLSSFSEIVPFSGVSEYYFGSDLEDFKLANLIDDIDVSLIGTTFELDRHLYQLKHDNIVFSFDKNSKKLVEMDIIDTSHGKLSNGVYVGLDNESLHKLDKTLIRTDIKGVYVSNDGYVIVTDEQNVTMILLFDKDVFKELCFYFKEREKRDNSLFSQLKRYTKNYLSMQNKVNEDKLVDLYAFNLDITLKYIKQIKIEDIMKLGIVLNRLIHDNNYFEDYSSNENDTLKELIYYVNEVVENEDK